MDQLVSFEAIFGSAPDTAYNQKTIDQIHKTRRYLENELFIDKLLIAVGISEGEIRRLLIWTS